MTHCKLGITYLSKVTIVKAQTLSYVESVDVTTEVVLTARYLCYFCCRGGSGIGQAGTEHASRVFHVIPAKTCQVNSFG